MIETAEALLAPAVGRRVSATMLPRLIVDLVLRLVIEHWHDTRRDIRYASADAAALERLYARRDVSVSRSASV